MQRETNETRPASPASVPPWTIGVLGLLALGVIYFATLLAVENSSLRLRLSSATLVHPYEVSATTLMSSEHYVPEGGHDAMIGETDVLLLVVDGGADCSDIRSWLTRYEALNRPGQPQLWIAAPTQSAAHCGELSSGVLPSRARVLTIVDPEAFARRTGVNTVPTALLMDAAGTVKAIALGRIGVDIQDEMLSGAPPHRNALWRRGAQVAPLLSARNQ